MTTYVPAALRRFVAERAEGLCEYCLIHEQDTFFGCQIEHVIAEKHGGSTTPDNLAFACVFCNRRKGSDIATRSATTGELVPLFNPRSERWSEHFTLAADGITFAARSEVGEATIRLLDLNGDDRLLEREVLRSAQRYPSPAARSRMADQ